MANPNIFNAYLQPPRSMADYSAELDKTEANQIALTGQRQGMADANALRRATQSFGNDTAQNLNALQRAGLYKEAAGYQKQIGDARKTEADIGLANAHAKKFGQETDTGNFDLTVKKADKALTDIAALQDPASAHASIDAHLKAGDIDAAKAQMLHQGIPQDPSQFPAWQVQMLRGIMSAKDRMYMEAENARNAATNATSASNNALTNQTSASNNAATNATSRSNNASTNATSMRGQNMTDARARELTTATMSRPFEATDAATGGSVLLRQDKQGNVSQVPGYGPKAGAKPLNEGQAKALGYGTRMQESAKILEQLDGKYSPAGINAKIGAENSFIGGVAGPVANSMLSDQSQQAEQAQRDFVNAVLRRESGAAISGSEFDNARKQYFNQPGDSKAVKDQKKRNRELAISGVLAEVPATLRGSITPGAQTATPSADADVPPEIAAILKKHGAK